MGVADTREEAMKLYKEPAEYFYGRCLHLNPRFASPPGYTSEATIRARVQSMIALAANASRAGSGAGSASGFDGIVDQGYVIVGSPDEVAEQLRHVAVDLNVGQLMMLMQFGNMSKELSMYNTTLFAEKVMPQLTDLFEDEWENRWWPKPMAAEKRATPRQVAT